MNHVLSRPANLRLLPTLQLDYDITFRRKRGLDYVKLWYRILDTHHMTYLSQFLDLWIVFKKISLLSRRVTYLSSAV
jgi:hypothetical protein